MHRERLTKEAACRLLRTRLRQYIFGKAGEIEKRRSGEERNVFDLAVDSEKSIEAASEAAWVSVLSLWGDWKQDPHKKDTIVRCISQALKEAIVLSGRFMNEPQAGYGRQDAKRWIQEFQSGFRPDSLLGEVPCALEM